MEKIISLKAKIEVIIVLIILLAVSVSAWSIKEGQDSTGQIYHGSTGLIYNSNGKAWEATGGNLQTSIYDFNNSGGTIYLPGGRITLDQQITVLENISIIGKGIGSTILDATGLSVDAIVVGGGGIAQRNITLEGFTLDGSDSTADGITLSNCWFPILRDIHIRDFNPGCGLVLDGGTNGCSGLEAYNIHLYKNDYGMNITNSAAGYCSINSFYGCRFTNSIYQGINISQSGGAVTDTEFYSCQIEGNAWFGMYVGASVGTRLFNCWFETNSKRELFISPSGLDFMMVGGSISSAGTNIEIKTISTVGHGAVFYNVGNFLGITLNTGYTYAITNDGPNYYLINGTTGGVERTDTSFHVIWNQAMTNIGSNGGSLLIKKGNYTFAAIGSPIQENTIVHGEGMDNTILYGKRIPMSNDYSGLRDITLSGSDAEGITIDNCHNTHLHNVNIKGYATSPVVFSNNPSNYSFINVKGVCQYNIPIYNESIGLAGANIPTGATWYDIGEHKLWIHEGSGIWKNTTLS